MKDKIKQVRVEDLPEELIEPILEQIKYYSIGLIRVDRDDSGEKANLIGSGTLIQVQGNYGILTAHHVASKLKNCTQLGIAISAHLPTMDIHKYVFDPKMLHIVDVGMPQKRKEFNRPDLAVMVFLHLDIGWLKAIKSFINIARSRQKILSEPFDPEHPNCVLSGIPGMKTKVVGPAHGYSRVYVYENILGYTRIEKYWIEDDFDYFEVSVIYDEGADLPRTFGGVSGGGVWRVKIEQTEDGKYHSGGPMLSGVACWEKPEKENRLHIICHGWRSIYYVAYNAVMRDLRELGK